MGMKGILIEGSVDQVEEWMISARIDSLIG
jgi:hypothetical protein